MKTENALLQLRRLDELASNSTFIHRVHPLAKLLTMLAFIITLASFPKYEAVGLFPLIIYPVFLLVLGDLPVVYLAKSVLWAMPFAVFIGILNPLFDRQSVLIGGVVVPGGWLSFATILFRFALSVMAALILISTTPFAQICAALRRLGIPPLFVTQLLFLYRYLYVLIEETARMIQAASLRMGKNKGIPLPAWGSLPGHLLLRTFDRAQRIYYAMLCRGYNGRIYGGRHKRIKPKDIVYMAGWCIFFFIARMWNIPQWIGGFFIGVK